MSTIPAIVRSSKASLPAYTRSVLTLRQLLRDVAAGIRVLQTRDGLDLSEAQITERARNIVAGLIGNYRIEALEVSAPRASRADATDEADHDRAP
ncbi:MAG TPA: hypothetical protein VGL59_01970 [Polyangia bacterium]